MAKDIYFLIIAFDGKNEGKIYYLLIISTRWELIVAL